MDHLSRLTTVEYWDSVHKLAGDSQQAASNPRKPAKGVGRWIANFAGEDARRSFADFHFWSVVSRFLEPNPNFKVLEIGAAPGRMLAEVHRRWQYVPYGVEYTPTGAAQVRRTLGALGYAAENVFEADAFSEGFQNAHRNSFDVVMSLGLIEHFENVAEVVGHHMNVLRPGGTLIIRVPRLQGINFVLGKLIDPGCFLTHNLKIMSPGSFHRLFERPDLEPLYDGLQGGFHFLLADQPSGRFAKPVLRLANWMQAAGAIAAFRLDRRGIMVGESAALSPFLLYVGRKRLS